MGITVLWGWAAVLQLVLVLGVHGVPQGKILNLPDLGRRLYLGELYDATRHEVVNGKLWNTSMIAANKKVIPAQYSQIDYVYTDKMRDKANFMDIDIDFDLSLMGGKIEIAGAFRFLTDKKRTSRKVRMSMMHKLRTVKESIDIFDDAMRMAVNQRLIEGKTGATHVVTGVTWGANTILTLETDYASKFDKLLVELYLKVKMMVPIGPLTGLGMALGLKFSDVDLEMSNRTSVYLHGDIAPPADRLLPTEPNEALHYMKHLHQLSLGADGKGVPLTIELTPLQWLDSAQAKFVRQINADILERAIEVYEAFDRSEEIIYDLLAEDESIFVAWRHNAQGYLTEFLKFRSNFAANLTEALANTRSGLVVMEGLVDLLQTYWDSQYNEAAVKQAVETKRDALMNLLALVEELRKNKVTMAATYSDYQAPTFDGVFDKVYALILVSPGPDRGGISKLREFNALAESLLVNDTITTPESSKVTHCVVKTLDNGKTKCVENVKFVAIHFDSFCNEMCAAKYCAPFGSVGACPQTPGSCGTDPELKAALGCWERNPTCGTAPEDLDTVTNPVASCWCGCPYTQVLVYEKSKDPRRLVDDLPMAPRRPTVVSHESIPAEDAMDQRVILKLDTGSIGVVTNFRVKIVWQASEKDGRVFKWVTQERIVDTITSSREILIRELVAGTRYRFMVAGLNAIGEGIYSDAYPLTEELLVVPNRPIIYPTVRTSHTTPPKDTLPSWRTFNTDGLVAIEVTLSTPAPEDIGKVVFHLDGETVDCIDYSEVSDEKVRCSVDISRGIAWRDEDKEWQVTVFGKSGTAVAWGNATFEGPSTQTCADWSLQEDWILCDTEVASVQVIPQTHPLHQQVKLVLNGSLHSRDLAQFRVRVTWRAPGSIYDEETLFDTGDSSRTITAYGLSAGVHYRFQVAGITREGFPGPYTKPTRTVLVHHNMPIIYPDFPTKHRAPVPNVAPSWFFNNTGRFRIKVGTSAISDELIDRVTFTLQSNNYEFDCTQYGPKTFNETSCTVHLKHFGGIVGLSDGVQATAKVYGVNGNVIAHGNYRTEGPDPLTCYNWEAVNTKMCNLTAFGVRRCVSQCEECVFNENKTFEFNGRCQLSPCEVGKMWCPDTDSCFSVTAETDMGCRSQCEGDTVPFAFKRICSVPCELSQVPGVVVPPGTTTNVVCPEGAVWNSVESPVNFTCPAENTQRVEIPIDGSLPARWAMPADKLPDCRKCAPDIDCNSRASHVSSNAERTRCVCECNEGYEGESCNKCVAGYAGYPLCQKCTVEGHCQGNAVKVTPSTDQSSCMCECKTGFTGESCGGCAPGYYGEQCLKCEIAKHCSGRAVAVTSVDGVCKCTCNRGWTGETCNTCDRGYAGFRCVPCTVKNCRGRGVDVSIDLQGNCVCRCSTGYAGPECEQCAPGYGGYPLCSTTFEVSGPTCPSGSTPTSRRYHARTCSGTRSSCTTSTSWVAATSVPTCTYEESPFGFPFMRIKKTCRATSVDRTRCKRTR